MHKYFFSLSNQYLTVEVDAWECLVRSSNPDRGHLHISHDAYWLASILMEIWPAVRPSHLLRWCSNIRVRVYSLHTNRGGESPLSCARELWPHRWEVLGLWPTPTGWRCWVYGPLHWWEVLGLWATPLVGCVGFMGHPTGGKCHFTNGNFHPTSGKCHPTVGKFHPIGGKCHPTGGKCYPIGGKCHPIDCKCHTTRGKCHPTGGKCHRTGGKCHPTGGKYWHPHLWVTAAAAAVDWVDPGLASEEVHSLVVQCRPQCTRRCNRSEIYSCSGACHYSAVPVTTVLCLCGVHWCNRRQGNFEGKMRTLY